jgi:hypothetical protein
MKHIIKICWVITAAAGLLASFVLAATAIVARGAPQQAAGAAMALGIVVIPYIVTKALDGLTK